MPEKTVSENAQLLTLLASLRESARQILRGALEEVTPLSVIKECARLSVRVHHCPDMPSALGEDLITCLTITPIILIQDYLTLYQDCSDVSKLRPGLAQEAGLFEDFVRLLDELGRQCAQTRQTTAPPAADSPASDDDEILEEEDLEDEILDDETPHLPEGA